MNNLPKIKPSLKTGNEKFSFHGENLPYCLLDFWKWGFSDILSNATRGKFAEFIVASALGVNIKEPNDEWSPFDLLSRNGLKIEIKTSAYIQSWYQKDYSKPIFSIKKSRAWDTETNTFEAENKRQSDVYIFCLLKEKDQEKINPLQLEQWEFYLVETEFLNREMKDKQSISLPVLKKITEPLDYFALKEKFTIENI